MARRKTHAPLKVLINGRIAGRLEKESSGAIRFQYEESWLDWEHRFEESLPLYLQVSRDGCTLHLTEHHGDCCPGAALRVQTTGLDAFLSELAAKPYRYARPGIEDTPWGTRDLSIKDPFGNRITFTEPSAAVDR